MDSNNVDVLHSIFSLERISVLIICIYQILERKILPPRHSHAEITRDSIIETVMCLISQNLGWTAAI